MNFEIYPNPSPPKSRKPYKEKNNKKKRNDLKAYQIMH